MRQSTLAQVLDKTKAHLGLDQSSSVAGGADTELETLIESTQVALASEWDWPFLADQWDAAVPAGASTVAIPTTDRAAKSYAINFERPVSVTVYYNQKWQDVFFGIGEDEYNAWDPGQSQAQDPILKWAFYDNESAQKVEVWPTTQTAQTIRFWGQRQVLTLRATGVLDTTKVLDLDDELVALFTAARKLARHGLPDAQMVLEQARERLRVLRADLPVRDDKVIFGGNRRGISVPKKVVPFILVHG